MKWVNPNNYSLAIVLAIALHLLVGLLFWLPWPSLESETPTPVPQHIRANVIQHENREVIKRREQEIARQKQERRRKEQKRQEQRQREKQKQKQRQERIKREKEQQRKKAERLAEQKAAAEAKRQQEIAKQKALEEQRQQAARQEAEQSILDQLKDEEDFLQQQQAERDAKRAAELEAQYLALIRSEISSVWRYPPAVDSRQEVVLRLTLVPTGEVIQIEMISSSGNLSLDRSVERAIRESSPLPVPDNITVFEQSFRQFTMKFRPENAN